MVQDSTAESQGVAGWTVTQMVTSRVVPLLACRCRAGSSSGRAADGAARGRAVVDDSKTSEAAGRLESRRVEEGRRACGGGACTPSLKIPPSFSSIDTTNTSPNFFVGKPSSSMRAPSSLPCLTASSAHSARASQHRANG